jgi:hypothetical protein
MGHYYNNTTVGVRQHRWSFCEQGTEHSLHDNKTYEEKRKGIKTYKNSIAILNNPRPSIKLIRYGYETNKYVETFI